MMLRRMRLLRCALACAALLACALAAFGARAEERMEVKIPVIAHGGDCTAVLIDAGGNRVQTLKLKAGEESAFTVVCEGLGRTRFTTKLIDADTSTMIYDKTVFDVVCTLFFNMEEERLEYLVEIVTPKGKMEKAEFTNRLPPTPPPTTGPYSPRTGDDQNLTRWLAIALASLFGIMIVVWRRSAREDDAGESAAPPGPPRPGE